MDHRMPLIHQTGQFSPKVQRRETVAPIRNLHRTAQRDGEKRRNGKGSDPYRPSDERQRESDDRCADQPAQHVAIDRIIHRQPQLERLIGEGLEMYRDISPPEPA
jgi:hypothetical protein